MFKKISDLSGGERGRVSLAKLMLSEANFLILDEPTNHLDITSKEILEDALNHYTGTVLYVSHDRYFINQVATRILELTPSGVHSYLGNYDFYLEHRRVAEETTVEVKKASDSKEAYAQQKTAASELRKKKKFPREAGRIDRTAKQGIRWPGIGTSYGARQLLSASFFCLQRRCSGG